jgi:elongator complex protein 5
VDYFFDSPGGHHDIARWTMAHTNLSHRRTHNLLLISKLLNQRDNVSPITLVLDSLEQPAKPLLREYLRRAKVT